jgi:hypothetical protein
MNALTRSIAACAWAAALALGPMTAAHAVRAGAYHIFPTQEYLDRMGLVAPEPSPDTSMLYFGGSVFSQVKVVSVMWGNQVNPTIVSNIPDFSGLIVNSTYVDQMSQYDTFLKGVGGHKGTKQHITRGTYLGQVVITPNNTSQNLSDRDVQIEIKQQIKAGVLPPHDLNTLYMVYFPVTVTITLDGLVSCRDFGAYHFATNDFKMKASNIFYTVEPDCHSSLPSITFAASHEFAEATTDNIPTPGSNPAFPQAWNTSDGFEIGDLCGTSGQLTGHGKSFTVTQYFLNTTGACSTGNYTSP